MKHFAQKSTKYETFRY